MTIEELLFSLPNPQVYVGREINVVRKPVSAGDLRVCLVFPEPYEIGMSHSGHKLLYHFLNEQPGIVAERAYLPDRRGVEVFLRERVPLFSLESRTPLAAFDVIGVSLMSELNFTNLLLLLDLSQIPLRSADRGEGMPLVVAGGIAAANPEPLREFVDAFACGDGEVLFPSLLSALRRSRQAPAPRRQALRELDGLEGFYIPALHPVAASGLFFLPDLAGRTVAKQVLKEFGSFVYPEKEIVPTSDAVFNRLSVEIARGCPQGCRFCQARAYYAPYRVRDARRCLDFIRSALDRTGYEAFSLAALSAGDHAHLAEILGRLPSLLRPDVSFSVPSLRPAAMSGALLETIGQFRRTGITIVPEAGSGRLRRALRKQVSDRDILAALGLALTHGWQRIKLYFMIGLPGETAEDIAAIVRLLQRLNGLCRERGRRLRFHVSFSPFVPKPHTPFQWTGMAPLETLARTIDALRSGLRAQRNMELDFHSPEKAYIETVLARGDARAGLLLLDAYRAGETFTAWEGAFHFPVWRRLIEEHGLEFLLGPLPPETGLPWEFLDWGQPRERLLREFRAAMGELDQPEPEEPDMAPATPEPQIPPSERPPPPMPAAVFRRLRVFYGKTGDYRFFSHLSLVRTIERLLRMAGWRLKCTEGFHPRPKIQFLPPLPVAACGENEVLEVMVAEGGTEAALREALVRAAPDFPFGEVRWCEDRPSLSRDVAWMNYRFFRPGEEAPTGLLEALRSHLRPDERCDSGAEGIRLRLAFGEQGPERFARVYRLIDPDRSQVRFLTRLGVEFKNER